MKNTIKHICKHKHWYALSTFGMFAVVKTFLLLSGILGIANISNTFAADNELNSTNIVSTYGCATSATSCNLSNKGITSIASGTFVNHNNLETLYLGGNQISSIKKNDFQGLSSLTYLSLYNSHQISSIEVGTFSELSSLLTLDLSNNQISSIEANTFQGLSNLKNLRLYGNQLSSLEAGTFSRLSNLTTLELSNNQLTSLDAGTFSGLSNLKKLYLRQNQILLLEVGAFQSLSSLNELYLGGNLISSIENGTFQGLSNLKKIELNGNQISSIEANTFQGLSNLTYLYLYTNQISSIEVGTFSELSSLLTLDLSNNQISSIEEGDFQGLSNLTYLYLYNNQISSIEDGTFSGLSSLNGLWLSYNQIAQIQSNAFIGLENLEYLDLKNNAITHIENNFFTGLSHLKTLELRDNQISSITSGNFVGLSDIVSIELGNNKITNIETNAFTGLDFLEILYLYGNKISNLPEDFVNLIHLSTLGITYNYINYPILDPTLLDFIDLKSQDPDRRTTQTLPFSCIATDIPQVECEALVRLYDSTNGSGRTNTTNWIQSTNICTDWYGIACEDGHVIEISLGNNNLIGILPTLSGLSFLQTLDLGGRNIQYKRGDGSGNQITNIETGAFFGLNHLQTLDLSSNKISFIESGAFLGLDILEDLSLSNNYLTSIKNNIFIGLENLRRLNLGGNLVTNISSGTFLGLNNLLGLSLRGTDEKNCGFTLGSGITTIESGAFLGLDILEDLLLGCNKISFIESGTFLGLENLENIDFSYNQLLSIHSGDFVNLPNLRMIDLSTNRIISLESGSLASFISKVQSIEDGEIEKERMEINLEGNCIDPDFLPQDILAFLTEYGFFRGLEEMKMVEDAKLIEKDNKVLYTTYAGEKTTNSQYVCAIVEYTPNISTSGSVIGNVIFSGGFSGERNLLTADNNNLPSHLWTDNGQYEFDLSTINDTGDLLRRDAAKEKQNTLVGKVTWITKCGNLIKETGEQCDDGNTSDGDGCSTICTIEPTPTSTKTYGGGIVLHKDTCPAQRDCSSSYYDNLCGPCSSTGTLHASASCDTTTSPYSPELTSAFTYAYSAGITTQCPITKANLSDEIIRSQFAKMISQYAIKTLKKQPNTKLACTFADIANESAELRFYMKTACQLGLMGRESDGKSTQKKFNPKNTMTRAQLGTVLSRLLYGNLNNSADSGHWFSKHLQALKTSGIMNDISKPYAEEIRGFILLMLQRIGK